MAKKKTIKEDQFNEKIGVPVSGLSGACDIVDTNRNNPRVVVCLVGTSGMGKTDVCRQVARKRKPRKPFKYQGTVYENSVPLITYNLQQLQPEDAMVPSPGAATLTRLLAQATQWTKMVEFYEGRKEIESAIQAREQLDTVMQRVYEQDPKESDTFQFLMQKDLVTLPPEGILFLDEWNRADMGVLKVFFTLIGERRIHTHYIPDGIQIVCAMNPSGTQYAVSEPERDPAYRRRLAFVPVTINAATWINYAQGEGDFHPMVVEYVKSIASELHDVGLRDAGKQYPTPAGWEIVSDLCKTADKRKVSIHEHAALCATAQGLIGRASANKFLDFCKNKASVITPTEIVYEYKPKGKVRRKVTEMLKEGRGDIISAVCRGVSIELMSSQPNPDTVKGNIGRFLGDLPSDAAVALVVHKLTAAGADISGANDYIYKLSQALSSEPSFERLFEKIAEANKRIKQTAGAPDPLA